MRLLEFMNKTPFRERVTAPAKIRSAMGRQGCRQRSCWTSQDALVITQIRHGQAKVITARRKGGARFTLSCGSQSMNPVNSWKPSRWIP